jgi:hemerythrin-like domain-containing protein
MKIAVAAPDIASSATSSFEDPLSLLLACHDKVRHFARLTLRLGTHVSHRGADAEAAQAAASILRYFDLAAPLHHADEEEDLFPALRALNSRVLCTTLDELEAEHNVLENLWHSVQPWLEATTKNDRAATPSTLAAFARRHMQHADREENQAYAAVGTLPDDVLAAIGRNMRKRRGAG